MLNDLRIHAHPVVRHREAHEAPGPRPFSGWEDRGLVKGHILSLDRDPAVSGQGIARVQHQVHDHLFYLARIGLHPSQLRFWAGDQLHVLTDQAAQHWLQVGHHLIEVQHAGLGYLPAAEEQQLARQRGRPPAGGEDLLDLVIVGVIGGHPAGQELAVANDGREQVVEVVGHPTGQQPEGLHPLRLNELRLQPLPLLLPPPLLGDVPAHAHEPYDPPLDVSQGYFDGGEPRAVAGGICTELRLDDEWLA